MIQEQHTSPFIWMQTWALNMGWPVIVLASFWIGRYVQSVETRANKAEKNVTMLIERHMPAIHKALAEIRGLLLGGR